MLKNCDKTEEKIHDKSAFHETTTHESKATLIVDKKSLKTTTHWIENISRAESLHIIFSVHKLKQIDSYE